MPEPVSDDVARNRWLTIQAVRFSGIAMVLAGILIVRQVIDAPPAIGWLLLVPGLAAAFLAPTLLAKRWRSPVE
ncbi:hypothetical protein [Altericroceibacterium xinjiangense]|uniref:hypothetical protein n=1 Tax=Altericroceibacterium xinjiangense TaxID=762261 RepID=UPI000F7F4325|nr:hypothetical protein [Altericroceibacterium xinjiangense]